MAQAKVMIVEDEAVTAMALEESLERLGYEVVASVPTGEEAVSLARATHVDAVLMDIRLRGRMDGVRAAETIRQEVDVPCVYLTAYSDEETLRRAKVAEPYGYIVKPYDERELQAAIEIAIHNGSMERARRAAQDALLGRERTLQDIVDNSPAVIYVKDTEGRYVLVNRRFEEVFGVSRAAARGKEAREVLSPGDLAALGQEDDAALREGAPRQAQQTLPGPDGPREYVALRFPLRHVGGAPYGVCAIMTDATDLLRIQENLHAMEARYRLIAESAPDVITLSSENDVLRYVSPGCKALLGYEPEELVGRRHADIIHPEDFPRVDATRLPEPPDGGSVPLTFRLRRKDGSQVWVEANARWIRDATSGNEQLVLAVTRDITERMRVAEEKVRSLNDELEARVRAKTRELHAVNERLEEFTHSLSHDVRAPVRGILFLADELEKEYAARLDPAGAHLVAQIRKESQRLSALLNELLVFSRATGAQLHWSRVDLTALAREVVDELRASAPERRAEVEIEEGLGAEGDPLLLKVVLENLLGNAWKFTSRRETARIQVGRTRGEADGPAFFVRDNGAGFDAKRADRLFQPFQRLHLQSDYPGTGLGLSSVRAIVERHGGRTWAKGEPDKGATFYFTLAPEGSPGQA